MKTEKPTADDFIRIPETNGICVGCFFEGLPGESNTCVQSKEELCDSVTEKLGNCWGHIYIPKPE